MRLLNLSCQHRDSLNHFDKDKTFKIVTLIEVKLFSPCSWLVSFYSLIVTFYLLLVTYCLLLGSFRSSHQRCYIKKLLLETSQNSQENSCARASFLIKLQVVPATLLKKRLWRRCFPVNLEFYWLKHCINLELSSVDLLCTYTCTF